MASQFIAQVQPDLQQDSGQETADLIRVLIYKIDNTTFGTNIPHLPPESISPPRVTVQVQAILYASLVVSLFTAFLAMLGKQWLNRYSSTEMRGSVIDRGRGRQQKLDGIDAWYFNYVLESLPLMLQGALFLLGCALSLYLWDVDATLAGVVLGVTLFAVMLYVFFIIAGATSVSCPYQTPFARLLRYILRILPAFPGMLRSAASDLVNRSEFITVLATFWRELRGFRVLRADCACVASFFLMLPIYSIIFPIYLLVLPTVAVYDACLLTLAIVRALGDFGRGVRALFRKTRGSDPKAAVQDLQCISWTLRTSMDKAIHLSALKLLSTMTALNRFSPALTSACFDALINCMTVVCDKAVVPKGSEELAEVSARCCLHTLSRIAATDPNLTTLKRVRRVYTNAFPSNTNFEDLPSEHSLKVIHNIFYSSQEKIQWKNYNLLHDDQVTLSHTLVELANKHVSDAKQDTWDAFFRGRRRVKVPRWILRFALYQLSQDPLPCTSIIINCLSIIAIDLGCTIATDRPIPDERYVRGPAEFPVLTTD